MNKKRVFGFAFIILSVATAISNIRITGAIIGIQNTNSLSLMAISFLLTGIMFLVNDKRLDNKIKKQSLSS